MTSSRGPNDAVGRLLVATVEGQPEPPRRIAYASVAVAVLRDLRALFLLLLGIGWAAANAAFVVSGPPQHRAYGIALMLLGIAIASLPLLVAWKHTRILRSAALTRAIVEDVTHRIPEMSFSPRTAQPMITFGSWRLPDGHVEPFQFSDLWALDLRVGSVVDLLVAGKSVHVIGLRPATEPGR